MRQLVTLPDAAARKLAGYLQTQSIETRLDETAGGVVVWVCDEDKVAQARDIAQHFHEHPDDERYRHAPRVDPVKEETLRRQTSAGPAWSAQPQNQLTLSLIVLSVLITALFQTPEQQPLIASYAFMAPLTVRNDNLGWYPNRGLSDIQNGEVWRLVTPIFVHFGVFHLLFNMLWLYDFGSQIEKRAGPVRLGLLILLIAVGSNQCQYLFSEISPSAILYWLNPWAPAVEKPPSIIVAYSPIFGGMSGVVFGLFGYIWIRSIYERDCGLSISPRNAALLLIWLVVCFTGLVGPIANVAHLVGMSIGMILGYAVAWWHGFGVRRESPL